MPSMMAMNAPSLHREPHHVGDRPRINPKPPSRRPLAQTLGIRLFDEPEPDDGQHRVVEDARLAKAIGTEGDVMDHAALVEVEFLHNRQLDTS
jgi:hypothetical protein